MSNVAVMVLLVLLVVVIVGGARVRRDRSELAAAVRERGGDPVRIRRAKKGHPFTDTGRGWWAWRVVWRDGRGERVSWALTTREGVKEWRD